MAEVALEVAGRRYLLACDDGEEARLTELAQMIDAEALGLARRMTQRPAEARLLLMAALLIADRLRERDEEIAALGEELAALRRTLAEGPSAVSGAGDLFPDDLDAARAERIEAACERIEGLTALLTEPR